MGISGLLPLLKEIQVPCNISDFKGKRYVEGDACERARDRPWPLGVGGC